MIAVAASRRSENIHEELPNPFKLSGQRLVCLNPHIFPKSAIQYGSLVLGQGLRLVESRQIRHPAYFTISTYISPGLYCLSNLNKPLRLSFQRPFSL